MRKLEIKVLFYIDSVHLVAYLDQIIAGTAHFERDVSGFIHLPIGNYSALHVEYAYHCTHLGSIDLQCVACSSDAERRHLGNRMKRLPWNFIRPNGSIVCVYAAIQEIWEGALTIRMPEKFFPYRLTVIVVDE